MNAWVSVCLCVCEYSEYVREWVSAFMFNYKRKEEAQEAVAGDKRARVQPQPQQQLLLRATEPALQHNQAAILVCCINTHDIYNTTIYYSYSFGCASVRLRRARIAFACELFAPISRYEIFFIFRTFAHRIFLSCQSEKNKLKVAKSSSH